MKDFIENRFRPTARVGMPVSSFGYASDLSMELEFDIIETRIDVRNSETKLENPVSITEPRYKIRQQQT
jgi:hypothetical protein